MKLVDYYQILFVYMKLAGHIEWPWIAVFLPTIIQILSKVAARMVMEFFPQSKLAGRFREIGVKA
jgi:hypothetical protein